MKTPQQWMDEHGYEEGVCCGHGDYRSLPNRLTPELVARIQEDARESLIWSHHGKSNPYRETER